MIGQHGAVVKVVAPFAMIEKDEMYWYAVAFRVPSSQRSGIVSGSSCVRVARILRMLLIPKQKHDKHNRSKCSREYEKETTQKQN